METIVRSLRPGLRGRVIERADLLFKPLLRRPPKGGLSVLAGRRVVGVRRRGKMALIELDGGDGTGASGRTRGRNDLVGPGLTLVFHLKMTGQLLLAGRGAEPPDKHTRLVVKFRDGRSELRFRDVRKFGFLLCVSGNPEGACRELACLGPEPLDISFDDFAAALRGRKGRIKSLLLDQTVVAGVGNIYADEMLFDARIHPLTTTGALSQKDVVHLFASMKKILELAIAAKGSSISDYVDADGQAGEFQFLHKVYDREGEPCAACGRPIKRIVVGGRGTHFCPGCQRE
ncbi:MAG: bifunctional DNA-formamidopyrimidine glycosylase/DNA-(apurinic or apyrimidinic site) lyase, partial [Acidobacteriota bacterium]